MRRKKTRLSKYLLLSLLILSSAIAIASFLNIVLSLIDRTKEPARQIVGMLDGIIGAIAAGFVLFQLKAAENAERHQNDISEASFLLQFNQTFLQDKDMVNVMVVPLSRPQIEKNA